MYFIFIYCLDNERVVNIVVGLHLANIQDDPVIVIAVIAAIVSPIVVIVSLDQGLDLLELLQAGFLPEIAATTCKHVQCPLSTSFQLANDRNYH